MKIPRGLTDKDMFKDYVEEETVEESFLRQEAKREQERAEKDRQNLVAAGFPPGLTKALSEELLKLKLDLFAEGVNDYTLTVKRDGKNIVITPTEKK